MCVCVFFRINGTHLGISQSFLVHILCYGLIVTSITVGYSSCSGRDRGGREASGRDVMCVFENLRYSSRYLLVICSPYLMLWSVCDFDCGGVFVLLWGSRRERGEWDGREERMSLCAVYVCVMCVCV